MAKIENSQILVGRAKSGRNWKTPAQKASQRVISKTLHEGYAKRMEKVKEINNAKNLEKELKAEKQKLKEERIKARKEKEERRMENERKAEVYQVITNTQKLKKLKKSQIRNIVKR